MAERSRAEVEHEVVMLLDQGMSRRAIARALGLSRNTVRKIENGHRRQREQGQTALPVKARRRKRARDPRPTTLCETDCKGTSEPSGSSGSTTDGSTSC